jgi:hypothetical protein
MISTSPKIIQQLSFKSLLKVSPFTNLPLGKWGYGYFWYTINLFGLNVFGSEFLE